MCAEIQGWLLSTRSEVWGGDWCLQAEDRATAADQNATKLIEKYTELAREALSNGDKILSENYLQHADHFVRVTDKFSNSENKNNDRNSVVEETNIASEEKK